MSRSLPAMVDLRLDPGGALILSWTEAPGSRNKAVPPEEIAHLRRLAEAVSRAESQRESVAIVETRAALSAALVELLDRPERALGQRIARADAERRRLDLVVRARSDDRDALRAHPATWMRWELLPFAETRRRGAPPLTVVLQLGPQDLAAPRVLEGGGLRIAFMAFSPHDARPEFDFEREEEELLAAIAPMAERRRARLRVVEGGTLEELRDVLLLERFDVVHLSGHGVQTPGGPRLVLEDAFGARRDVEPAELIEVLERAKAMPELVMVSCCNSAEVRGSVASFAAELVAAGVPNVVGWTRPVGDGIAMLAASVLYEQIGAGKTPVEAMYRAREQMRREEERTPAPAHAWGTLHLVSGSAAGFRVDDRAEPLSERVDRDEVYRFLGSRMRVLETGFVGRRRLVQRLLRVIVRGQDLQRSGARDVAGACVFGMKGVGKSCVVGRAIERAKQHTPELGVVVVHGAIDERAVLDAFQEAVAVGGGDGTAEKLLARTEERVFQRVRRLMEHWRRRPIVIVLDDFEQNLDRGTSGPWLVKPEAAALLEALLPTCATGKPKLLITSTAEFRVPWANERALAFVPVGALDEAAVRKLWMRGRASNELANVSLEGWHDLADRLGRNARVLAWARALLAGKTDEELAAVAASASAKLPVWAPGDEASENKHAELAELFLRHMAYEQARAAFGEPALEFVKRARVFEDAVPKDAFAALAEGLAVDLDRDLGVLASWGLLEVGELDGVRAYRVNPLVEPQFKADDAARWHEVAAEAWEALAEKATSGVTWLERTEAAWEHALRGRHVARAERLARRIDAALYNAGLYAHNLRLAERHVEALPESAFGQRWLGYAEFKAGRAPARAGERIQRGHALLIRAHGTEEHPEVATSLNELGGVLRAQGDFAGARKALERSLAIQAKVHGTEEHPSVAASLHELGGVLRAQGDLAGARKALERSLAIQAEVHGTEEHPSVTASLHALGGVLMAQGDLAGARKALERSLAIKAEVHGTEEHPEVAASLHALGGVLMAQGDLAGARKALERSLAIQAEVHGTEEHPEVAASLHELGSVLMAQGDLAGARKALERSLAIDAKVHGTEEHPEVAASLHELGRVLRAQGDLAGARKALERSLAIDAKVYGTEEHPSVAVSLHELGSVLRAQGDLAGARKALERSLAIKAKVYGTEEHPSVAASLHALGGVLRAQDDLAGAREALERSLAIKAKVYGTEEHPSVAASLHALGGVLMAQGDLAGARKALERSLAIKAKVHGTEEHPSVAASLHELGRVLRAQGDLAGARKALERSLAIDAKVHGTEEHPSVAVSLHELGSVLRAQGDLAGARKALERSLAIKAKVYGTEEHPSVAVSLHALGGVLRAQDDLAGAREALERSLAIKAKVYGTEEHPSVAASLHELGGVLRAQGDLAGARKALERSLAIQAKVHGTEEHPNVATSLHELGGVLRAQGDLAGARKALERSLGIQAKAHGTEDHPSVAASLHGLARVLEAEGELDQAAEQYRRVLAIEKKCFGTLDQYHSAETEAALAMLLFRLGQQEEAGGLVQHALQVLAEQVPNHPMLPQLRALMQQPL
ncbi:tetratricopeptide repeat protein [Sorangium sp. So ce394]|uniref:tetratricopeptide repeat protein n=1 Tax=Sorangium sp. So ce394 TaxID=3133310 RepID=UPI003F5BDF53